MWYALALSVQVLHRDVPATAVNDAAKYNCHGLAPSTAKIVPILFNFRFPEIGAMLVNHSRIEAKTRIKTEGSYSRETSLGTTAVLLATGEGDFEDATGGPPLGLRAE